jgi:hypothetical protein
VPDLQQSHILAGSISAVTGIGTPGFLIAQHEALY